MSTTVDERIVAMKFDNREFERNTRESIGTLGKLKDSLNLSESAKGLNGISEAARKVSFSGMADGIESVKLKFSALEVMAVTALVNITNSALNAGKRMASALTIDPIKTGFQEYETQINAIQTILANTQSKGTNLKDVSKALDELNTYSDKTIYNFTEMAKNIGTFTAAGVELDTSVAAIKGIANLAAVSGSNSQQASTAMYQLSQALASGTVKLMDWNSVVNAGMGGQVFQDALKETARVHDISIDSMIKKQGSFRETLKNGWLTSDILTETLSKFTGDLNADQLKTMGYSKDQITEIIKLGKTANDAATKVKTFTQLFDTLKEAAQSGWAQSWEIIVGDFEEAKVLLTDLSNTFGSILGASAKARNDMLQGWKDLGGRTALIQAVRNAFEGVMDVIQPIHEAFREIFPRTTAQQLFNITKALEELTSKFKLSTSQSENLKMTFKGLFAVLDIGKQLFVAIWNAISPLLGGFGVLSDGVLGVTATWGEWAVSLDETIRKTNIFSNVLQAFVGVVVSGIGKANEVFVSMINGIKNFAKAIQEKFNFSGFELFHAMLQRVQERMSMVGDTASDMKSGVTIAFETMGNALVNCKFFKALQALWNGVKIISGGIVKALGNMATDVTEKIGDADFNGLFDMINSLSIGAVAIGISQFLKGLSQPLEGFKGVMDGITGTLDGVRGCFEAYQTQLKAGALMKIATAIAILTVSIVAISLIDSDKLAASLGAITVMFGDLLASMAIFNKIGAYQKGTLKACISLIAMATAVAILAGAMKTLGDLSWDEVAKGIVSIVALSTVMVASAKILSSGSGQLVKGSVGLVTFALAIKVLASACKDLSELSWTELGKGLLGVGVLLGELSIFLNTAKFSGKAIFTATGILILSAAIKVLASACKDFGAMSWEEISKGLASIGMLLTAITLFTKLTGDAKHVIATGVSLIFIASAMKIMASALIDFGAMSWEEIGRGLTAMGVALAEIVIAMKLMPKNLLFTGAGLVVVATALTILTGALGTMGGMSWSEIAKGLVMLGGSLAILAVGLTVMNGTLAGSAALLIASAALAILAPTLSLLGAMSWESIGKGLIALAGAFTILGIAGLVLTPLIVPILALSGALALIGVGVAAVGVGLLAAGLGIQAIAVGLGLLATMGAAGAVAVVAAFTVIVLGITGLIPEIAVALAKGIISFVKVIGEGAVVICEAVTKIILAVLDAIAKTVPVLVECVVMIIDELLKTIAKHLPSIIKSGTSILLSLLKGIANGIHDIVTAGLDIIVKFLEGVAKGLPKVIQAAFEVIISFINGLADAIRKNADKMTSAVHNLFTAVVEVAIKILVGSIKEFLKVGKQIIDSGFIKGITSKIEAIKTLAHNIISGFINGMIEKIKDVANVGKDIAQSIIDSVKNVLDIHSPSRVFKEIGENVVQGQINGMIGMKAYLKSCTEGLFNDALVKPVKKLVNTVSDSMSFGSGALKAFIREYAGMQNTVGDASRIYNATQAITEYGKQLYKESDQYKEDTKAAKEHQNELENLRKSRVKIVKELAEANKSNSKESKNRVKELKDNLKEADTNIKAAKAQMIQDQKDIVTHTRETFNALKRSIQDSVSDTINPLKASLDTQIDLFTAFGSSTEVTIADVLKNMQSQIDGVTQWKADLNALGNTDIAPGLLNKLKEMGPSGVNYVKAFTTMTNEELQKANDAFEKSSEITAQTLIDNFNKSLTAASTWADNLTLLSKKGLNQDILEGLGSAGMASADYIDAFLTMTPEQILAFNNKYKEYLKLPAGVANEVLASFAYAGTDASKNFATGLSDLSKPDSAASKTITATTTTAIKDMSKKANALSSTAGKDISNNLARGMTANKQKVTSAADDVSLAAYNSLNNNLSAENGRVIGEQVCAGLIAGINSAKSAAIAATTKVAKGALNGAKTALGIHSPSKEFEALGMYSDKGFAVGISKYSNLVAASASNLGTSAISGLRNSISKISEVLANDMDTSMTIRPVLDLTNVTQGAKTIGAMFSRQQVIAVNADVNDATNSTTQNGMPKANGNNIQFTQNNYSPKALSRVELYRQTKNQFSAMKGLVQE